MDESEVVECPACSQRLRVPADRGRLRVTCPECDHSFAWSGDDPWQKRPKSAPWRQLLVLLGILIFTWIAWPVASDQKEQQSAERQSIAEDSPDSHSVPNNNITETERSDQKVAGRLQWRLGSIDSRFNLSESDALRAIEQGIALWEAEAGTQLFTRDDKFGFPINFVFDERQELAREARAKKNELTNIHDTLAEARRRSHVSMSEFTAANDIFKEENRSYEVQLDNYNRQVAFVNASGGASSYQKAELDNERSRLDALRYRLELEQGELRRLQDEANENVRIYNGIVKANNGLVHDYNARFGNRKDTLGECIRNSYQVKEITIYCFDSNEHLAVVLAHELGHALGMEHVPVDGALMSEVEKEAQRSTSLHLSDQDKSELKRVLSARASG